MINILLNVLLVIVLIGASVVIVAAFRNIRKARKLNRRGLAATEESEALNRRLRAQVEEREAINRRSRELLATADAAWKLGERDDCDQEDEAPTSTRQVDPWAEIHHPDKHQPAAVQPAGVPANMYLCQCGQKHQRPEPLAQPTEPTAARDLTELESLGWNWNEIPTAYVGHGGGRMTCFHCGEPVIASPSIPSCTNPQCPGKLDFLHEIRAQGNVVRGSN